MCSAFSPKTVLIGIFEFKKLTTLRYDSSSKILLTAESTVIGFKKMKIAVDQASYLKWWQVETEKSFEKKNPNSVGNEEEEN